MTPRTWKLPAGIRTIEVNGYEMAYLERGEGRPLVLIHGSLSDYRGWRLQMAPFSDGFRTIAVSLRHCYPEPWDGQNGTASVRQHAEDLSVFIRKLESGPVHLLGHSRGGDVALTLAAAHPGLIRRLVLADPAPLTHLLPGMPEVISEIGARSVFVTAALERMQQGDLDGGLELFTDAVSRPGTWKRLEASGKQIRRDNAWSLKRLVADGQDRFNADDAANIDAPVLLVTGDKSPRLYGLMHDALQKCLKRREKITIPDASHGMFRDNPEGFNAVVMAFLSGNAGG